MTFMGFTPQQMLLGRSTKTNCMVWTGYVARMWEKIKANMVWLGNMKERLGRPRCIRKDNINMYLKEIDGSVWAEWPL